ncbi:MAG: hypothetical protein FWC27_04170 [Firmicutes bacterium]|nr:hypothetical protein [Bacillota bacterium]
MKKCKRVLAILLAALMIGGAMMAGASAAEPTKEQIMDYTVSILRLYPITTHMGLGALLFKSGKNLETLTSEFTDNWKALGAEKGLDAEVLEWMIEHLFDDGLVESGGMIDSLYFEGVLDDYVNCIVTSYEKAVKNNHNFLGDWLYSIIKWFIVNVYSLGTRFALLFA